MDTRNNLHEGFEAKITRTIHTRMAEWRTMKEHNVLHANEIMEEIRRLLLERHRGPDND